MKILIADDDNRLRNVLLNGLSDAGFEVSGATSGGNALEILTKDEYDILLLDLDMPDISGMSVLKKIKKLEMPVEAIILTGQASVPTAVEAMKVGAYDYLTKPVRMEELKAVILKAYEKKNLLSENLLLRTRIKRQQENAKIITCSPIMTEILATVKKVAASDSPILICGESGTGKELMARAVHEASEVSGGPFIPVNCGAIPENMLESELFGHEKGAFTGAHERKPGLLEIANNGIFFLDEICEMPQPLQVKLLRVIETGSFRRLGGTKEIKVHLKFVAATNKDAKAEVDKGNFRADLYYRISALTLHIPPLRERKEDIPLLIEYWIGNKPSFKNKRFGKDALDILCGYHWPGNIRELQNLVQRTLLLSESDIIGAGDIPIDIAAGHKPSGRKLEEVEREHILRVLKESGGQKAKAAEILGIDPKTLYRKLLSYGVK